jgi:hypothetical protein
MRIVLVVAASLWASVSASAQDTPAEITNVARDNWHRQIAIVAPTPTRTSGLTVESVTQDRAPGVTIPDFAGALQDYINRLAPVASLDSRAPFGGGFHISFLRERVEVFGGAGGVFVPWASSYTRPNSWLIQTKAGVHVALDPNRRIWLGTTTYLMTNLADKTRERAYATADLTLRFGK